MYIKPKFHLKHRDVRISPRHCPIPAQFPREILIYLLRTTPFRPQFSAVVLAHGRLDEVGEPRIWRQVRGFFVPGRLLDLAARFGQNDARKPRNAKSSNICRTSRQGISYSILHPHKSSLNKTLRGVRFARFESRRSRKTLLLTKLGDFPVQTAPRTPREGPAEGRFA